MRYRLDVPARNSDIKVWLLLVVWTLLIGWWSVTPLTETLTVRGADGAELIEPDGSVMTIEVECGAPIARDIGTPAVSLPEGATLERTTCERTQSQNRVLLWINVATIGAGAVGMLVVSRRRRRALSSALTPI